MNNFPFWLCYHFTWSFSLYLALVDSFSKEAGNWVVVEAIENLFLQAQFCSASGSYGRAKSCFGGSSEKENISFSGVIIRCLSPSVNPHNFVKYRLVAMYKLAHSITCTKCHINFGSTGFLSLALFPTGLLIIELTGAVLIIFFFFSVGKQQSYNNGTAVVCLPAEGSPTIDSYLESCLWKKQSLNPLFC